MALAIFNRSSSTSPSGGLLSRVPLWVLRFLQFVFAITVIGLYAQDLNHQRTVNKYSESRWGYATAVGTIGAVSSLLLLWPALAMFAWAWDFVVFILFIALFGLFASMFVHGKNNSSKRMKNAVWIDLINALLWLVTALYGLGLFFTRGRRSTYTGRATV
ncbi:MAG: hypothetical protein Q9218_003699 [Villophora microphyllina]